MDTTGIYNQQYMIYIIDGSIKHPMVDVGGETTYLAPQTAVFDIREMELWKSANDEI